METVPWGGGGGEIGGNNARVLLRLGQSFAPFYPLTKNIYEWDRKEKGPVGKRSRRYSTPNPTLRLLIFMLLVTHHAVSNHLLFPPGSPLGCLKERNGWLVIGSPSPWCSEGTSTIILMV